MKFTPPIVKAVLELVEQGMSVSRAGETVGLSRECVSEWMRNKPEFAAMVRQSEGRCMSHLLDIVTKGAENDPKLALDLLGRRFPSEFGRSAPIQISNKVSSSCHDERIKSINQQMLHSPAVRRGLERMLARIGPAAETK